MTPYTGTLTRDLIEMVQRAEQSAMAEELLPFHGPSCSCDWCADVRDQGLWLAWQKRYGTPNEEGLRRCTECEEFKPIVAGSDECEECLRRLS